MAQKNVSSQIFWGGALIILGVGLALDQANVWDFGEVAKNFWPMLFILPILFSLLNRSAPLIGSLIFLAIGVVLQLAVLDILDWNVWAYIWPLILVVIGIRILTGGKMTEKSADSQNSFDITAMFSGVDKKVKADNFDGGNINAFMGGAALDLRESKFADESTISIFAMFGGAEIRVPADVKVEMSILPVFGGAEDATKSSEKADKVIHVRGNVLFGGIEIKN